jgi:curved DNA-binding protein
VKFRDYYEILGVPRGAKPEDIKRAYRKAARKHHPDVAKPSDRAAAEEEIKLVNEAYEVLRDPQKRARYDALGANWKAGDDFAPPERRSRTRRRPVRRLRRLQRLLLLDLRRHGRRQATRRARRGPRARARHRGRAAARRLRAPGRGQAAHHARPGTCAGCRHPEDRAHRHGAAPVGPGRAGPRGRSGGDLYLHVRVHDDARYKVEGDDIAMDLPLWPWQAVLGATVRTEIPDGTVDLKIAGGTVSGGRLRLKGPRPAAGRRHARRSLRGGAHRGAGRAHARGEKAFEALRDAAHAPKDRPAGA